MNATSRTRSDAHIRIAAPPVARRSPATSKALGVVDQVSLALKPKARLATVTGFLLGGFVPLASYVVSHYEIDREVPLYLQIASLLVLGGLCYSARTVYTWGKLAFHSGGKAAGFVVLVEGVMVVSHTSWLALSALVYLIVINGIATGCNLSLGRVKGS